MQVWDDSIIETEEERFYSSNFENLIDAIQTNITVLHNPHSSQKLKCLKIFSIFIDLYLLLAERMGRSS